MVWNGFALQINLAVLANCSDIPHDKEEILRISFDDPKILISGLNKHYMKCVILAGGKGTRISELTKRFQTYD